jgi:hypothetical protein
MNRASPRPIAASVEIDPGDLRNLRLRKRRERIRCRHAMRSSRKRSQYYPLFSTIAQAGQFLDLLHRPGNVHDSRDALVAPSRAAPWG